MSSFYGRVLADIHDSDFAFVARAAAATAMSLLPPPAQSGIIVDLGCGSGVTAEILDEAGYSVVGIDASPDMIAIARGRVPDGDFITSSIDRRRRVRGRHGHSGIAHAATDLKDDRVC